jgi:hypothetical protein
MAVRFESEAQRQTYEKMSGFMRELFGEFATPHPDFPRVDLMVGSVFVVTIVLPWGDSDSIVRTRCYVVTEAELKPELLLWLLQKNYALRFGSFGVDDDNDIFLQHTLVGSSLDKTELQAMVMAIVQSSDELDDEIVARWGGLRYAERKKGSQG